MGWSDGGSIPTLNESARPLRREKEAIKARPAMFSNVERDPFSYTPEILQMI